MLYLKAFHIIAMVAWFAALFYLPRLFVYHSEAQDKISLDRFKVMERRLYYGIMWPAGLATTVLGLWLITDAPHYYLKAGWMHAKLMLVLFLWCFHLFCGRCLKQFKQERHLKSAIFYRALNEIPTILLIGIVLLVVVKP